MIPADKVATLTSFNAMSLTRAIRNAGYNNDFFASAEFLGITNGGQFCYKVQYKDEGILTTSKVFVTYNPGGPLHGSFITVDY